MAIDIRYIVNVYPSTLPPGAAGLELNGLLLTRNGNVPVGGEYNGVMQFTSASYVRDYFGALSDEYAFAVHYFAGADTAIRRPRSLLIASYDDTPRPAWVRGQTIVPLLSTFKAISSGNFSIDFSGETVAITPVNLSAITSFSEVADILQAALRAQGEGKQEIAESTVTFNASAKAFQITMGGTGADGQTLGNATGNLAEAMRITEDNTIVKSTGTAGETAADILDNITKYTQNWATFSTIWNATTEEKVAFAQWQALNAGRFMYVAWDENPNLLIPFNEDNDATILAGLNVDVAYWYGGFIYAAFNMGVAASVDYSGLNTVITYAHKAQTGMPYNVNDTTSARALENKGVNFYGNYALRNDQFQFAFPGRTLGEFRWIDHYVNSIWFFSALETGAAYGLRYAPRIPYNEPGRALIRAFYMTAVNAAVTNGTIDVGLRLSEAQKAIVIQQAGFDITPYLERNGYYLQVRDPDPSVRVDRGSTDNRLWYTYAGSVHRLDLNAISIT